MLIHSVNVSGESITFENLTEFQRVEVDGLSPAGIQCLTQSWASLDAKPLSGQYCEPYWDGNFCWPATLAGHNISVSSRCSQVPMENQRVRNAGELVGFVSRLCLENATWNWEEANNYSSCPQNWTTAGGVWTIKEVIRYTLFIGSVLSLLFIILALFLFCHFKSIRCDRITIHIHFMAALAIKSCVLILISDPTPFSKKYYYRDVDWICKLVIIVQLYSYMASINWMLIQGHFLNSKLATDIFQRRFRINLYYCYGWGMPAAIVLVWFILMRQYHNIPCWRKFSKSKLIWIVVAPIFSSLLANLAFMINIIRILVKKIRLTSNVSEGEQFRRAAKATAFLFPLLGINNLIFFFNPGGTGQIYYMMTNAILQPLQGILVSIFYCFICKDVRDAIRREYFKFSVSRNLNSSVKVFSGKAQYSVNHRGNLTRQSDTTKSFRNTPSPETDLHIVQI